MPGRCAAPPAPAMITLTPGRPRALGERDQPIRACDAPRRCAPHSRRRVRCSVSAARRIVGQSDWLPMMMATGFARRAHGQTSACEGEIISLRVAEGDWGRKARRTTRQRGRAAGRFSRARRARLWESASHFRASTKPNPRGQRPRLQCAGLLSRYSRPSSKLFGKLFQRSVVPMPSFPELCSTRGFHRCYIIPDTFRFSKFFRSAPAHKAPPAARRRRSNGLRLGLHDCQPSTNFEIRK